MARRDTGSEEHRARQGECGRGDKRAPAATGPATNIFFTRVMKMAGKLSVIIFIAVSLLALSVRLPGLGSFMTADEANWMERSDLFWEELFTHRNPGGTFMSTHPGSTAMWLIGAGITWQEIASGLDFDEPTFFHFRKWATFPVAIATSLLIGLLAVLAMRLFGRLAGLLAGALVAIDPYLTGLSQIAHLDALFALLLAVAALAFLVYRQGSKYLFLVVAGVASGLAVGTKFLPSVWLFAWIVAVLILVSPLPAQLIRGRWKLFAATMQQRLRIFFFVCGVAAITFYASWPALWVKDDVVRSFERDIGTIITDEHVALEVSEEPIEPATFYIRTVAGRTTMFTLLLTTGVMVAVLGQLWKTKTSSAILWLLVYSAGFLVLITFAAKKGDRYALPTLTMMPLIAGYGFAVALRVMRDVLRRWHPNTSAKMGRVFVLAASGVVVLSLIIQTLLWSPYAIAYNNPLFDVRPLSQQGWGEGLDAAARWLNEQPFIEKLTIASWYPDVTGAYFAGQAMSLSSRDDHRVGYVVTYRNMGGRAPDDIASNVLDEYKDREPVHVVTIHGKPYAWIYTTLGPYYFRQHTGEILPGMEAGQTIPIDVEGWRALDIALADFGRTNTSALTLHIREVADSPSDLRTVTINTQSVKDQEWHQFTFEPIEASRGKTFYVALTSSNAAAGNAVTARYYQEDVMSGQALIRRRALLSGEQNSSFFREGDIAYRIPQH